MALKLRHLRSDKKAKVELRVPVSLKVLLQQEATWLGYSNLSKYLLAILLDRGIETKLKKKK